MAKYVIEIGLDSHIAPRNDGTYPHLMSLIQVDDWNDSPGKLWSFTHFGLGDQIAFRVCDYTDTKNAAGMSVVDVKGIFACFLRPKDLRLVSDSVSDGVICSGQNYFPVPEGKSLLLKALHSWRFVDSPDSKSDKFFTLTSEGRALLRVSIAATVMVGSDKELRWFTHDPEIIVGEGSDEPPHRRRAPRRRKG